MAEQNKTTVEDRFMPEGGPGTEADKIADALAKANAAFFDALRDAGIEPLTTEGSYDRGGCGHDRSK